MHGMGERRVVPSGEVGTGTGILGGAGGGLEEAEMSLGRGVVPFKIGILGTGGLAVESVRTLVVVLMDAMEAGRASRAVGRGGGLTEVVDRREMDDFDRVGATTALVAEILLSGTAGTSSRSLPFAEAVGSGGRLFVGVLAPLVRTVATDVLEAIEGAMEGVRFAVGVTARGVTTALGAEDEEGKGMEGEGRGGAARVGFGGDLGALATGAFVDDTDTGPGRTTLVVSRPGVVGETILEVVAVRVLAIDAAGVRTTGVLVVVVVVVLDAIVLVVDTLGVLVEGAAETVDVVDLTTGRTRGDSVGALTVVLAMVGRATERTEAREMAGGVGGARRSSTDTSSSAHATSARVGTPGSQDRPSASSLRHQLSSVSNALRERLLLHFLLRYLRIPACASLMRTLACREGQ